MALVEQKLTAQWRVKKNASETSQIKDLSADNDYEKVRQDNILKNRNLLDSLLQSGIPQALKPNSKAQMISLHSHQSRLIMTNRPNRCKETT
jgi:hypothetical protein